MRTASLTSSIMAAMLLSDRIPAAQQQTNNIVVEPEPVTAKRSRQVRRQEERTGLIGAVPTYYGGKPPYVARSKYMPHIGAKQRAKAFK